MQCNLCSVELTQHHSNVVGPCGYPRNNSREPVMMTRPLPLLQTHYGSACSPTSLSHIPSSMPSSSAEPHDHRPREGSAQLTLEQASAGAQWALKRETRKGNIEHERGKGEGGRALKRMKTPIARGARC